MQFPQHLSSVLQASLVLRICLVIVLINFWSPLNLLLQLTSIRLNLNRCILACPLIEILALSITEAICFQQCIFEAVLERYTQTFKHVVVVVVVVVVMAMNIRIQELLRRGEPMETRYVDL